MLLCGTITTFTVDQICYAGLSQRLPIYPDAEVQRRSHNLLTEFGMGNTVIVLYSPDEPEVVRSWYGQQTGTYIRGTMESGSFIERVAQRIAQGDWSVTRAESGSGSQIILFGTCVN
jgi:hypothetical protein